METKLFLDYTTSLVARPISKEHPTLWFRYTVFKHLAAHHDTSMPGFLNRYPSMPSLNYSYVMPGFHVLLTPGIRGPYSRCHPSATRIMIQNDDQNESISVLVPAATADAVPRKMWTQSPGL